MSLRDLLVRNYMTTGPHSVGAQQSLAVAHEIMRQHRVRHLPVLDGGYLVGVVSDRDLHLVETLRDVDPDTVPVEDAMSIEVYRVTPETPLVSVATVLAERKIGSAVVMDNGRVVGMFTTIDALRALADLLRTADAGPR